MRCRIRDDMKKAILMFVLGAAVASMVVSFAKREYPKAQAIAAIDSGHAQIAEANSIAQVLFVTNAGPIVVVSDSTADPYAHPTTHPASRFDELNLDPDAGHGDGITTVVFAGKVVQVTDDGQIVPVDGVSFFRLNDSMLLREKRHDRLPFVTDTNGDFHVAVDVFAASGLRKGSTNDWVSYQTGTAVIGVEDEGYEPRRVNVRFGQPSTLIVLKQKE